MNPEPLADRNVSSSPGEVVEAAGCRIVLRRVEGPAATEFYVHGRPLTGAAGAADQAQALYGALRDVLEDRGADIGTVVAETVFLRDPGRDLEPVRGARRAVLAAAGGAPGPAAIETGQPPLDEAACLEVMAQAVVPHAPGPPPESIAASPRCACPECARAHGRRFRTGDEVRFHAAGLCGPGESAYEQTLGMFGLAEDLLERAGLGFGDVVRTWIHLRDIDRDYGELNRARRAFFEARGIDPVPASTGIGGGPAAGAHDLSLALYAVKRARPAPRVVMTAPTLNEAMQYGADFVRGMRVAEANKIALHVSGTASIDEEGRTVHAGDIAAQADRMLLNISALLAGQGAGLGEVVSAVTYLKHPSHGQVLRERLRAAGFGGFPHALVVAPICRPDLLCETEALAVLPGAGVTA